MGDSGLSPLPLQYLSASSALESEAYLSEELFCDKLKFGPIRSLPTVNVLDINLSKFNVSQSDVGWIGFSLAVGGTIGGVISGRVCDMFPGHMTRVLASLYGAATILIALFILALDGVLPYSIGLCASLAACIGFAMVSALHKQPKVSAVPCISSY